MNQTAHISTMSVCLSNFPPIELINVGFFYFNFDTKTFKFVYSEKKLEYLKPLLNESAFNLAKHSVLAYSEGFDKMIKENKPDGTLTYISGYLSKHCNGLLRIQSPNIVSVSKSDDEWIDYLLTRHIEKNC